MDSTAYILNRVSLIQAKVDSFSNITSLKELNFKLNEQADIINKVNQYYDSAWTKLIFVLSAALAIIGVVLPLIIQYYQKQRFNRITADLQKDFNEKIQLVTATYSKTKEELNKLLLDHIRSANERESVRDLDSQFTLYHLQAMIAESKGLHAVSCMYELRACRTALEGNFSNNSKYSQRIRISLENGLDNLKRITTKTKFEDEIKEHLSKIFDYHDDLERLKKCENSQVFKYLINPIEEYIAELK
jgi:hypothetical protein